MPAMAFLFDESRFHISSPELFNRVFRFLLLCTLMAIKSHMRAAAISRPKESGSFFATVKKPRTAAADSKKR